MAIHLTIIIIVNDICRWSFIHHHFGGRVSSAFFLLLLFHDFLCLFDFHFTPFVFGIEIFIHKFIIINYTPSSSSLLRLFAWFVRSSLSSLCAIRRVYGIRQSHDFFSHSLCLPLISHSFIFISVNLYLVLSKIFVSNFTQFFVETEENCARVWCDGVNHRSRTLPSHTPIYFALWMLSNYGYGVCCFCVRLRRRRRRQRKCGQNYCVLSGSLFLSLPISLCPAVSISPNVYWSTI